MSITKPTLKDVAELAGVSRASVSLALRGHPKSERFSDETVRRIRMAARELDYRPNFFVSQMRQNTAQMVMVYVNTLQDLYSGAVAESFQRQAADRGFYTVISAVLPGGNGRGLGVDRRIIGQHGISAVVLIGGAADRLDKTTVSRLLREKVQVLVIGRDLQFEGISKVLVDYYQGGRQAADYIYQQNPENVWMLGSFPGANLSRKCRLRGVMEYVEEHGYPQPFLLDIPTADQPLEIGRNAYQAVRDALDEQAPPDAIITNLDLRAMGVLQALDEKGLQAGRDVAVIGYDDIWPSGFVTPSLTTIHQPTEELGRTGADLLLDMIEGKVSGGRTVTIEPRLIERESGRLEQSQAASPAAGQ
jgi:DNA-binding LacI/PurR family transcriptional regulator